MFFVNCTALTFSKIIAHLFNQKAGHEAIYGFEIEYRIDTLKELNISDINNKIIDWWNQHKDYLKIKSFQNLPDDMGGNQLKHLAALAFDGDFNTLMDQQEFFERGHRLNFVPMITKEVIDRA